MSSNLTIAGNELPVKLFVYGTLMSGFCNHFLMEGATFIGPAKTVDGYALYSDNTAYVNTLSDTKTQVMGELYEVLTPETLEDVDDLFGHPEVYVRSLCRVHLMGSDTVIDAQMFVNNRGRTEGVELVTSGDYRKAIGARYKLDAADNET